MMTSAARSLSPFVCLVGVGCAVLSLGFGSCDGTSVNGSGGTPDSGVTLADTGSKEAAGEDSGAGFDAGLDARFEAGAADTGTSAVDAGEDAGICGEPQSGLGAMCDECLQTNCEPTWCQCAVGEPDPDAGDAGSGCLQYVQCVEDCVEDDGGSPTSCLSPLCAVAPFTTAQEQAGHAFLDCLVQYCGESCGL
jgi:hypothetical protein